MVPEDGTQHIPDYLVMMEAANIIVAGTDTTAMSLTYLIYEILRHPRVKTRLIEELKGLPAYPSGEQLENLPYLNNVIQENFRLNPGVPGSLPRDVPEGGVKFGKYYLSAGTTVSTQAYTFGRDKSVFHEPMRYVKDDCGPYRLLY